MMGQYEDDIAKSGKAFSAEGIGGSTSSIGNVVLWNPYSSGKILLLDQIYFANGGMSGQGYNGHNLRNVKSLSGFTQMEDGHWSNKAGDVGPAPKAQVWIKSGATPADYPYNRPHHEFWLTRAYDDKPFDKWQVPYIIQQGRGKNIGAQVAGQLIATFHWREEDDPLGVVTDPDASPPPSGALSGSFIGDALGSISLFDGNEVTYATSNGDAATVMVGLDLGAGNTSAMSRVVIRSPTGRSFCGANPARSLTWAHFYSADGTNFSAGPTGSFTDSGQSSQCILDVVRSFPAGRAHKIKLTSTSAAGWRVAELVMYA